MAGSKDKSCSAAKKILKKAKTPSPVVRKKVPVKAKKSGHNSGTKKFNTKPVKSKKSGMALRSSQNSSEGDVDLDRAENVDESRSSGVASGKSKGKDTGGARRSRVPNFEEPQLDTLTRLCFHYNAILEGNIASSEVGLTKADKITTWKKIADEVNRYVCLFLPVGEECEWISL